MSTPEASPRARLSSSPRCRADAPPQLHVGRSQGGPVLRWRVEQGEEIQLFWTGGLHLWIDGAPVVRPTFRLCPGRHVLALATPGPFGLALLHREDQLLTATATDGRWLASPPVPGDWLNPHFDDRGWSPLRRSMEPGLLPPDLPPVLAQSAVLTPSIGCLVRHHFEL